MKIRSFQPIDEMERVTPEELTDRFDEILGRIDDENIGFVITENGKDRFVLCPYDWNAEVFDRAIRDAIDREIREALDTAPENAGAVQQFIRNHCAAFDLPTLSKAIHEIEKAFDPPCQTAADPESWNEIKNLLSARKAELEKM